MDTYSRYLRNSHNGKMKKNELVNKDPEKIQAELMEDLEQNPEYSLEVDPTNKYNMPEAQKLFIRNYVEFKSIMAASEFAGLSPEEGKRFFVSYASQQEIRRINKAMYHHQFANKLLDLDQIGGYLTSLLIDDVPLADQIKSGEKLRVAQMLIDLNKLKLDALIVDPSTLMNKDLNVEIHNLSIDTIKRLLETKDKTSNKEKKEAIEKFDEENKLTVEEKVYLESLPTKDILALIEDGKEKK